MILSFEEVYYEEVTAKKPSDENLSDHEKYMMNAFERLMKSACEKVYKRVCNEVAIELTE